MNKKGSAVVSEKPAVSRERKLDSGPVTAGVDIGSVTAQAVIFSGNQIVSYSNIRTGPDSAETAWKAINTALGGTQLTLDHIAFVVGTGYGRYVVPYAQRNISELSCHAKGVSWFFPNVHTILDMGGQDCKAMQCDEKGKVTHFLINDKCAAGCGRSIEVIADLLSVSLEQVGSLSQEAKAPPKLSSTCVVFAKSEALSLIRRGVPKSEILGAYCDALAHRISNLIKRLGMKEDFAISGGIAKNVGVVKRVEELLGVKALIAFEPQICGALGAAIYAQTLLEKAAK